MNNDLITPGVPALNDEWIALRTQHLVEEVSTPTLRRKRRFILVGVSGSAAATAAILLGLIGTTPAFAGWSPQPTSPSSGQLSAAETACTALAANLANLPGASPSASLPPESLSDVRGPYTLIVYGTASPALCVSGSNFTSMHQDGGTISIGSSSEAGGSPSHQWTWNGVTVNPSSGSPATASSGAVVHLTYTANENGASFAVALGSVGSQVSGATLLLSDGSSVAATVSSGLFAAWWPGQATVSSIQVTTTTGVN